MKISLKSVSRLILPYIIIAMLPILSLLILWGYVVSDHTQKVVADQDQIVKTAVSRVDEKVKSVTELSYLISDSRAVLQYRMNAQAGQENDFASCKQIQDLLSSITKNDEIAQVYFYDEAQDRIIASDTILNDALLYFRYTYQVDGMEPAAILSQLQSENWTYGYQYMGTVLIDNRPTDVLEYRIPLPLGEFGNSQPQLVICLDAEHLFQDLFDILGSQGQFAVYSSDTLLYSSAPMDALEQTPTGTLAKTGKHYAAQRALDNALWQIRFLYPEDGLVSGSWNLTFSLVLAIILPVLICICLCVYFTYKNYREILELLALLRGQEAVEEEPPQYVGYHLVRRYADQVVRKNISYQAQIQVSQKTSTLERLLRNSFRSQAQKQEAIENLDLPFTGACLALCIQMEDINTEHYTINNMSIRDTITGLLQIHIGAQLEVVDISAGELVYILEAEGSLDALVDSIVSLLSVQLSYPYGLDLKIGIGGPVNTIGIIHRSYEQAIGVIRYSESTGTTVRSYHQMGTLDEMIFYPVLTDDKLSNYIIAGHAQEAKEVVLDIYRKNFQENARLLSPSAIDMVKYRISNAVMSVAEKQGISIPETGKEFLKEKNTQAYFAELTGVVDMITAKITEKKNDTQNVLAARVQEYVQENYRSPGLSIKQIANYFHFHENYISNLYKEEFGENLSSAIERLRIEEASRLLKQADVRVGDVASAVGYSSDSTFRRAFKKLKGVSPADYRSTHTR